VHTVAVTTQWRRSAFAPIRPGAGGPRRLRFCYRHAMELNEQEVTTPPRPAATVVLLREGDDGLEVFMLKRHGLSDVLGGAYVFPGGKLDQADSEAETLRHLDSPADRLHAALGEPELDLASACGLFVAALRETFEEAGLLFALGAQAAHAEDATRLSREGHSFAEVLERLDLPLAASSIAPWSRWITPRIPSVMNKRFDTRFFVAAVPEGMEARHDDHEATESLWLAPRRVLESYWRREVELAPPQIQSLAHLCRHATVEQVIAEARSRRPPLIQPEPFQVEGERVIAYPGDERHPVRERALPGPTRLVHRNGRFEPLGGFEEFFD
jgi:8-oxo-dGTP pyrophosphatase MutT (NUDIX family)